MESNLLCLRVVELLIKNGKDAVIETYLDIEADLNMYEKNGMEEQEQEDKTQSKKVGRKVSKTSNIIPNDQKIKYYSKKSPRKAINESFELHLYILFFSIFALICSGVAL